MMWYTVVKPSRRRNWNWKVPINEETAEGNRNQGMIEDESKEF
jgi:hypothetical protein